MSVARSLKFPSPLANQAEQLLLAARPFAKPEGSAAVSLASFFQTLSGGQIAPGTSTAEQPAESAAGSSSSAAAGSSSSSASASKVAFLGLGAMGQGMAASIVRAGIPLTGYDVYPPSLEAFVKAGGTPAKSAREACEGADVVVLMVVSIDQATELLLGKDDGRGELEGVAHRKHSNPLRLVVLLVLTLPCLLPCSPCTGRDRHPLVDVPALGNARPLAPTWLAPEQATARGRSRLWWYHPGRERRPEHHDKRRQRGDRQGPDCPRGDDRAG
jgi:hypothetical protein